MLHNLLFWAWGMIFGGTNFALSILVCVTSPPIYNVTQFPRVLKAHSQIFKCGALKMVTNLRILNIPKVPY